jgi:hypothetical protein
MADRINGIASTRSAWPGTRGDRMNGAVPLALYSAVAGGFAVGLGALAAFLVPGGAARGMVWLAVTAAVAVGAGLWWGLTPVTDRHRVLHRALTVAEPRRRQR